MRRLCVLTWGLVFLIAASASAAHFDVIPAGTISVSNTSGQPLGSLVGDNLGWGDCVVGIEDLQHGQCLIGQSGRRGYRRNRRSRHRDRRQLDRNLGNHRNYRLRMDRRSLFERRPYRLAAQLQGRLDSESVHGNLYGGGRHLRGGRYQAGLGRHPFGKWSLERPGLHVSPTMRGNSKWIGT